MQAAEAEVDHRGQCFGGVVSVTAGVDESDLGVDAFDETVGDAEFDGVDDAVEVKLESTGQLAEWADAAVGGAPNPAS